MYFSFFLIMPQIILNYNINKKTNVEGSINGKY